METLLSFMNSFGRECWHLLLDSSIYILLGLLVAGLLKVFLSPAYVVRHLGHGRFMSVFKAAIFGIPIPLCSCGVLPAAASLKKQGANNGATTAFLIATPESGVDSISITYALLDPLMTVARPLAAFVSACVAGISENIMNPPKAPGFVMADLSCPVDNCCDGIDCPPEEHGGHHSMPEKLRKGLHYAATDIWGDLAGWFFIGIMLAGLITVLVPDELFVSYLGGGLSSMLLMLLLGIPLYICATASTPIAAAFILKGVSPGAALVFLLVGPATNITSLSVLVGILGKRATALYLVSIAGVSVACGLVLDGIYGVLGISAIAVLGQAAEVLPGWLELAGALVLLGLSVPPLFQMGKGWFVKKQDGCSCSSVACCGDEQYHHDSLQVRGKKHDKGP